MKKAAKRVSVSLFPLALAYGITASDALANTIIPSENGLTWEVYDQTADFRDSGGIHDGGQDAFDAFGMVKMRVMDGSGSVLSSGDMWIRLLGLTWDGNRSFSTTSPEIDTDIRVERSLFSPGDANYMRYIDTFTNTGTANRQIMVAWGG
jgi:hypothetical protein